MTSTTTTSRLLEDDHHRMPHTIFVWDFDWTVINCNSDEYVPAQFMGAEAVAEGFRELYRSTGGDWHACVEGMVHRSMTETNASKEDILEAARQMPYLSNVRQALEEIHIQHPKTAQMILSDGNTLFIGAFLAQNNLVEHFSHGVVSNKGFWNQDGKLSVEYQSMQYGGHSCDRCAANLCKTQALAKTMDHWFSSIENKVINEERKQQPQQRPRIVYVGDGANDACPVLHVLGQGDVLLARAGHKRTCANQRKGCETDEEELCESGGGSFGIVPTLQQAQEKDGKVPHCQVLEWRTGRELHLLVQKLLQDT